MPKRDSIHGVVRQALIKAGWTITDDPYVISYGERFLFIDLAAVEGIDPNGMQSQFIGAQCGNSKIAIEIKQFRGQSAIASLEQAIGQYVLYQLLLKQIDPQRQLYLAVGEQDYTQILSEPIGELVINELPLNVLVIDLQTEEIQQWIPPNTPQS